MDKLLKIRKFLLNLSHFQKLKNTISQALQYVRSKEKDVCIKNPKADSLYLEEYDTDLQLWKNLGIEYQKLHRAHIKEGIVEQRMEKEKKLKIFEQANDIFKVAALMNEFGIKIYRESK